MSLGTMFNMHGGFDWLSCVSTHICSFEAHKVAESDILELVRWTLASIQSYFTGITGRWIPRPRAEKAVQDCQNFCVPYLRFICYVSFIHGLLCFFMHAGLDQESYAALFCWAQRRGFKLFYSVPKGHMQVEIGLLSSFSTCMTMVAHCTHI